MLCSVIATIGFVRHTDGTTIRRGLPWASWQIRIIAGAHAPGRPGTFSPPPRVSAHGMHHGTRVTHVPWCMPGALTSSFLWSRRRGETFPAFSAHAHPQFYVSGKRPMEFTFMTTVATLIARFMVPTWGPSRADRPQVGPMLAPWTLPFE